MKSPSNTLPGLDRLISTCQTHHLRAKLHPPLEMATTSQRVLLGQPLDPVLVSVLQRHNGMLLADLGLYPLDDSEDGLEPFNASMRTLPAQWSGEWPLRELLLIGRFDGFAYYLATVPSLADDNGTQPVVYVSDYDGIGIMPIASNVDRAFDLYARYLDALTARNASLIEQYGSIKMGHMARGRFHFPDSIPALVAEDGKLVEMLEANRFEVFTSADPNLPKWSATIRRAARGQMGSA